LPVTTFGAPGRRVATPVDAVARIACRRGLTVSWIQQLKSRASTRVARSQQTPTACRNRHHRNKSIPYDRSVDGERPAAINSRRNTRHRPDYGPIPVEQAVRLELVIGGDQPTNGGDHQPGKIRAGPFSIVHEVHNADDVEGSLTWAYVAVRAVNGALTVGQPLTLKISSTA
jgi:hypothetical protein